MREFLEKNHKDDLSRDEAIKLTIKSLLEVVQTGAKNIEISVMESYGKVTVCTLISASWASTDRAQNLSLEEIEGIVADIEREKEAGTYNPKRSSPILTVHFRGGAEEVAPGCDGCWPSSNDESRRRGFGVNIAVKKCILDPAERDLLCPSFGTDVRGPISIFDQRLWRESGADIGHISQPGANTAVPACLPRRRRHLSLLFDFSYSLYPLLHRMVVYLIWSTTDSIWA